MTKIRTAANWRIRLAAVAFAAVTAFSFSACGNKDAESDKPEASQPVSSAPVAETSQPEIVTVKMATISNLSGSLNIRSEPNTNAEILGTAKAGERFEVLTPNCQAGWHEISYNSGKAYISSDFATITDEQQTAPTPTPDPNAPIIVNGSGREDTSSSTDGGLTQDSINETEDPARR